MADHVSFQSATLATPAASTSIATDDVGGNHYQRVKLDVGGDGASVPVLAGTGTASSALRVALADSSAVAATQSGSWSVSVTGTVAISAAALPLPSGAATAAKQPALGTAGTPSSDVISVQGVSGGTVLPVSDGGGALTVDGTVSISGSVTVTGTVAATQSGTWTVTGAGGTFPVTDSGGSLTVDAPVGTPIFVRLSDGASAISTLPVSLASVPSHAVTNAGTFAVQAASAGDVAHDAADSGNPVKIGAKATTGLSGATMVADADRVNAVADVDGAIIHRPYCPLPDAVVGNASNTDGTSTEVIAAQASGVRTYITTAILTNMSATGIYAELKDGTTVMARIPVPASGGAVVQFPVPLRGTAATAWNVDGSAAVTTLYCTLVGFKSKV